MPISRGRDSADDGMGAGAATPRPPRALFVTATIAAREGRYADALRGLQAAREADGCSEAEALDLQARIHAQQGRHLLAEACWRRAQGLDDRNPTYASALERLRRDRLPWTRLAPALLALAGVAAVGLLLFSEGRTRHEASAREAATAASLREMRAELAALREGATRRDSEFAATAAGVRQAVSTLEARVTARLDDTGAGLRHDMRRLAPASELKALRRELDELRRQSSSVRAASGDSSAGRGPATNTHTPAGRH